jgi:hypothetical protein
MPREANRERGALFPYPGRFVASEGLASRAEHGDVRFALIMTGVRAGPTYRRKRLISVLISRGIQSAQARQP